MIIRLCCFGPVDFVSTKNEKEARIEPRISEELRKYFSADPPSITNRARPANDPRDRNTKNTRFVVEPDSLKNEGEKGNLTTIKETTNNMVAETE